MADKPNIIPFGKYKGQPIEVLSQDPQYLEWLQSQDWFKQRYGNINTLIINNFREPSDTPEHNKMQAMFTDKKFIGKFITHVLGNEKSKRVTEYSIGFECKGIDVILGYKTGKYESYFHIELKPVLSDDYPAVLRQMQSNNSKYLLTKEYNGIGATLEQVRFIFSTHNKFVYLLPDLL